MIELRPASTHRVPILVLIPTEHCNLACDYCFGPPSRRVMDMATVAHTAREYAELCRVTGSARATVCWQGGEVMTLHPEWVRDALDCFKEAFAPYPQCTVRHQLQTNLIALEPAWIGLIRDSFDGSVGTSLDYPNTSRRLPGQSASDFEALWLARYRELVAADVTVAVIAIVGDSTLAVTPDRFLAHYYETLGVTQLQVNLPFPSRHRSGPPAGLRPDRFNDVATFMAGLYREWKERYRHRFYGLMPFDLLEQRLHVPQKALPCAWETDCTTEIVSVGVDGTVGTCDCWVLSYPDACYGNVGDGGFVGLLQGSRRRQLSARSTGLATGVCQGCRHWSWCHGGCPMRALAWRGSAEAQDPYCCVYQAVFDELRGITD